MSKVYATAMVAGDLAPEAGSGHAAEHGLDPTAQWTMSAAGQSFPLGRRNPNTDLLWDAGRNGSSPGGIVRDMPRALPLPPPGFDALPVDEQIEYVQSLWDRIAASVDQVPLQLWQQALLEERLSAHRRAPEDSQPWQDVIDRIQGRLQAGR